MKQRKEHFSHLVAWVYKTAVDTPYQKALKKLRFLYLLLQIVFYTLSLVYYLVLSVVSFTRQQWLQASLISSNLVLYSSLIFLIVYFYLRRSTYRNHHIVSTYVITIIRIAIKALLIAIPIIHLITNGGIDSFFIISLVFLIFGVLSITVNIIHSVFRLRKLRKNHYTYSDINKVNIIQEEKRLQMYDYAQQKLKEILEFQKILDEEYRLAIIALEKNNSDKHPITIKEQDIPLLGTMYDGEYPFNGITRTRETVRAVLVNHRTGKIALNHVVKEKDDLFGPRDYYELPGGGKELGESLTDALFREIVEEVGFTSEITAVIGRIDDYYNPIKQENHTYYYLCKTISKIPNDDLMNEYEKRINTLVWVNIHKAIRLYEKMPNTKLAKLIKQKELLILKRALQKLEEV
ncbi:MAG: NUDIX hydrolase [Erysipelotrichaceae bacterium]|jgi:8-oxo-dGTP diphosphatase|nr:NUDIX hydrolase [Erysipelotrichaceae bacterium]